MHGLNGRRAALLACAAALNFALPGAVSADTGDARIVRRGSLVTTGGTLDFNERRTPPAQRAQPAPRSPSGDDFAWWRESWLYWMLHGDDAKPRTRARSGALPLTTPSQSPLRSAAPLPLPLQASPAVPPATGPALSAAIATPPATPPASNITTSSIAPPRPPIVSSGAGIALVRAADRSQARADLVKFELAARSYNERRLSGQSAFDLRSDWRILERAKDALPQAELAAAEATGFEANAYINDAERTIVVALASVRDLRREFVAPDAWQAMVAAERPQLAFLAKSYVRSVMHRYQMQGYTTECVGHSVGGGACAYAAHELGLRGLVVNPIGFSGAASAEPIVTTYLVDGDLAGLVPEAAAGRPGSMSVAPATPEMLEKIAAIYGPVSGHVLIVRDVQRGARLHRVERVLDLIATHAEAERTR